MSTKAQQRRELISEMLRTATEPISAMALAERFSISRQSIVGDIALLRASGLNISATPRGYAIFPRMGKLVRQITCCHSAAEMEAELNAIVSHGCVVKDVIVEHPIYGQITGWLQVASYSDVSNFIRRCTEQEALPLSLTTNGVHMHTLVCPDQESFNCVLDDLDSMGILVKRETPPDKAVDSEQSAN